MASLSRKLSNQMKTNCNDTNEKSSMKNVNKTGIDLKQFAASPKKMDKLSLAKSYEDNEQNTLASKAGSKKISVSSDKAHGEQPVDQTLGQNGEGKNNANGIDENEDNITREEKSAEEDDIVENDNENNPLEQSLNDEDNQSQVSDTDTEKETVEGKNGKRSKNHSKDNSRKKKRVEKVQEDGEVELPTFKNSVGKTFDLDLTDEVKEYVKELNEKFNDDDEKNPTLADFKNIGAKALAVLLRFNDRAVPKGATKVELAKLVHDYVQNGCPPRCPKCKRGSLRFSNGKKKSGKRYYWCPGSATSSNSFYGCNFKADRKDIQRIPWKSPD